MKCSCVVNGRNPMRQPPATRIRVPNSESGKAITTQRTSLHLHHGFLRHITLIILPHSGIKLSFKASSCCMPWTSSTHPLKSPTSMSALPTDCPRSIHASPYESVLSRRTHSEAYYRNTKPISRRATSRTTRRVE
jgi:hypothetical protein